MALTGTEGEIILIVARLGKATKEQIRRGVGFSLEYIDFLCRYLIRKGHLTYSEGYFSLAEKGMKAISKNETPRMDRKLIKDIASELAGEIREELIKTMNSINIPVTQIDQKVKQGTEDIKIRTDFDLPIEDESKSLESNIDKIGISSENEESDIEKKVELLKKFQKRSKK